MPNTPKLEACFARSSMSVIQFPPMCGRIVSWLFLTVEVDIQASRTSLRSFRDRETDWPEEPFTKAPVTPCCTKS